MLHDRRAPGGYRASLSSGMFMVDQAALAQALRNKKTVKKTKRMSKIEEDARLLMKINPEDGRRKSVLDQTKDLMRKQNKLQTIKNCCAMIQKQTYVRLYFYDQVKHFDQRSISEKQLLDDSASAYAQQVKHKQHHSHHWDGQENQQTKIKQFPRQDTKDRFIKLINYLVDVVIRNKTHIMTGREKILSILNSSMRPTHPVVISWNLITMLLIIHNILVIPLQDAFDANFQAIECNWLLPLIQFELFAMILEIVIQFNVAILREGNMIIDKREIALGYLRNGFIYDVLGLVGFLANRSNFLIGTKCVTTTNILIRLAKYLFLFKKQRLRRLISFFKQAFIQSKSAKNISQLVELLFLVIIMAHYIACYWIMAANYSLSYYSDNWIKLQGSSELPDYQIYLQSVYFACMTMTTVGYGDILPRNPIEYATCVVIMLFSCGFFAYSLNTITHILVDIQNRQKQYKRELETIEHYMNKRRIDIDLQNRIKSYLKGIQKAGLNDDQKEELQVISKLSSHLQEQLHLQDKGRIFHQIPVIRDNFSKDFIFRLIDRIKEVRLSPGEIVQFSQLAGKSYPQGSFVYLDQGHLEIVFEKQIHQDGKKKPKTSTLKLSSLKTGDSFGLSYLFGRRDQQAQDFKLKSQGFSVLFLIQQDDIIEILRGHSDSNETQRYCMIRDKVTVYGDLKQVGTRCLICEQTDHEFPNCYNFFLVPNPRYVVAKHDFSIPHGRSMFIRHTPKRYHSLMSFSMTRDKAALYNDESLSSQTDEYNQDIIKEESDEKSESNEAEEQSSDNSASTPQESQQLVDSGGVEQTEKDEEDSERSWRLPENERNGSILEIVQSAQKKQLPQILLKPPPSPTPTRQRKMSVSLDAKQRISLTMATWKVPRPSVKVAQVTNTGSQDEGLSPSRQRSLSKTFSKGTMPTSENRFSVKGFREVANFPDLQREKSLDRHSLMQPPKRQGSSIFEARRSSFQGNQSIDQNMDVPSTESLQLEWEFDRIKEYVSYFPQNNFSSINKRFEQKRKQSRTKSKVTIKPNKFMPKRF